jgi:hypothetical protein
MFKQAMVYDQQVVHKTLFLTTLNKKFTKYQILLYIFIFTLLKVTYTLAYLLFLFIKFNLYH